MAVPLLRFKEFQGDWSTERISKFADVFKGRLLGHDDITEDGLPCILYGDLYTKYDEIISTVVRRTKTTEGVVKAVSGDVIVPSSGETAIDIATSGCVLCDDVILGGDLIVIRHNQDGCFISYSLSGVNKKKIARLAEGASIFHLYPEHLKKLDIRMPQLDEQHKIANLLELLDKRIKCQQRKVELLKEYKKLLTHDVFSRNIVFEDENTKCSAWKRICLGKCYLKGKAGGTPKTTYREYYVGGQVPFLSITDMTGQGKHIRHTEKHITELGVKNSSAWRVPPGSLILSMYASVGFVSINTIELATSQAMFSMIFNDEKMRDYVYYFLQFFRNTQIHKYIEVGTQGNINADVIKMIPIYVPAEKERDKISNLLGNLDCAIENNSTALDGLLRLKAGLLSQMFV